MTINEIDDMKWLFDALDHLVQYDKYAEHMKKEGKGFSPTSPFSPKYIQSAIKTVIQKHLTSEPLTPREQHILSL